MPADILAPKINPMLGYYPPDVKSAKRGGLTGPDGSLFLNTFRNTSPASTSS